MGTTLPGAGGVGCCSDQTAAAFANVWSEIREVDQRAGIGGGSHAARAMLHEDDG